MFSCGYSEEALAELKVTAVAEGATDYRPTPVLFVDPGVYY